jgi:DNA helicase IV
MASKELSRDEQRAKDRADELALQERVRVAVEKSNAKQLKIAQDRLKSEQNITVVEGKP